MRNLRLFGGLKVLRRHFATRAIDPYLTIGVKRTDDMKAIKKRYYELVAEYHPDKNDSPAANEKFKDILEAYELIKFEKGVSVKRPLIRGPSQTEDDGFKSRRPNANQYSQDFDREKEKYGDFDSADFAYRTTDQKYAKYTDSFKEMYEANKEDFKPIEGELPNTLLRFNLEEMKGKNKKFKDSDTAKVLMYLTIFAGGIFFAFSFSSSDQLKTEQKVLSVETKNINLEQTVVTKNSAVVKVKDAGSGGQVRIEVVPVSEAEIKMLTGTIVNMSKEEKEMQLLQSDDDILVPDSGKSL